MSAVTPGDAAGTALPPDHSVSVVIPVYQGELTLEALIAEIAPFTVPQITRDGHSYAVTEVLLVLDATTGQNGLTQARIFAEVVNITGIVLTKLDGSAKGGIVVQVQRELGVPVKLVGLGEGVDDLAPFDAEVFVDALLDQG